MLYLTGGITNPFSLLLIALAVLAAATLPGRHALVIGSLTLLASLLLTVMPLHSGGGSTAPPRP
jgi:two-component system sensor histidine kinase RegB